MQISPHIAHKDFRTALLGLYNTINDLTILQPDEKLVLPPADTGFHPPGLFNASAALAVGYSNEAISLMAAMPCLNAAIEIEPSTYPECYIHVNAEFPEDVFQPQRELLDWLDDGPIVMPPSAIRFSWDQDTYMM